MQRCLSLGLQDDPEVRRELDILLVSKLKEREIEPRTAKVSIPDAAIEAEYERRIDEFTRPAQVRLAGLMLTCNASATEATQAETRARLEEARRQIIASPAPGGRGPAAQGFGAVAVNYTDDQVSRYRGGDLGWFRTPAELTRWPQEIAKAGFALKKGEVSEVLQAGDGFYLIMKADERAAQIVPLDTVRESLRRQLESRERESIAKAYVEEAVTAAGPVVNEALLASVELPAPRRGTDPVDGFQPPVVTTLETNADEK